MKIFKEIDIFCLIQEISGSVIGEQRNVVLPVGTAVAVVLVHGDPNNPIAYEIEAYIPEQNCYALATIEVAKLIIY